MQIIFASHHVVGLQVRGFGGNDGDGDDQHDAF